jgi:hypothetical protein
MPLEGLAEVDQAANVELDGKCLMRKGKSGYLKTSRANQGDEITVRFAKLHRNLTEQVFP